MPKINALTMFPIGADRWIRGVWIHKWDRKAILAVGCPRCRAAKTWPCTTEKGNDSSTIHAARWEAYRATLEAADSRRT